jgi:6-phosphogluconate dehydrogenase
MSQKKSQVGLVGLAAMGKNLVLNMAGRGNRVSVFSRTTEVTRRFIADRVHGGSIVGAESLQDLMDQLERPSNVLLMVKDDLPVDGIIDQMRPFFEAGNLVIDGGNSHFADTARREACLASAGIRYLGFGISGGEKGAFKRPSIMPGAPESPTRSSSRSFVPSRPAHPVVNPALPTLGRRERGTTSRWRTTGPSTPLSR